MGGLAFTVGPLITFMFGTGAGRIINLRTARRHSQKVRWPVLLVAFVQLLIVMLLPVNSAASVALTLAQVPVGLVAGWFWYR